MNENSEHLIPNGLTWVYSRSASPTVTRMHRERSELPSQTCSGGGSVACRFDRSSSFLDSGSLGLLCRSIWRSAYRYLDGVLGSRQGDRRFTYAICETDIRHFDPALIISRRIQCVGSSKLNQETWSDVSPVAGLRSAESERWKVGATFVVQGPTSTPKLHID